MDSRLVLAFLSVFIDSSPCACVPQCLHVWTLVLALAFLSVCMDSRIALVFFSVFVDSYPCACVSQCLYGLLCLRLHCLVYGLKTCATFLSACMDFCICACVSQCFYGLLCLRLRFLVCVRTQCLCMRFSVFVWSLVFALVFRSVCMDSFVWACGSQCLYGWLRLRL